MNKRAIGLFSCISRIEGDIVCTKYQKGLWGVEFCATVFRNHRESCESKNEYFFSSDIAFAAFASVN